MRELIIDLSREHGKTILISSHLLNEVEQMATRMLIIHEGRKIVEGPVAELLHPADTLMEVRIEASESIMQAIRVHGTWSNFLRESSQERLLFKMDPNLAPELNRWLVAAGAGVRSIQARHSLEAYFLSLTHHAATAH
jgi:ABC-type multidrug transport system ATPase subunit